MLNNLPKAALRGISWMILSGLLYVMSAGAIRYLGRDLPVVELVFFRAVVALGFLVPVLLATRIGQLKTRRVAMHGSRGGFAFLGMMLSFYAVTQMPIADVYALQFTLPLVTILAASVLLGERVGMGDWISCLIGFAGALVILRPGIVEVSLAALAALASSLCYAGANISVKSLTRTETAATITVYSNVIALACGLVPTVFVWVAPSWDQVPWIVFLGVTNAGGGYCIAKAIGAADSRVVQPFDFLRLIYAAGIGWVLFAEFPDVWTWVGGAIIFIAAYFVLTRQTRPRPA